MMMIFSFCHAIADYFVKLVYTFDEDLFLRLYHRRGYILDHATEEASSILILSLGKIQKCQYRYS